ncbi:radical SAM protein [Thermicanus aegyptius]|uniref:radical SAM protein n=1 Tax=Thermicanus aegyptius TaxID=94009 RepID=UPI000424382C|nr:radical SAM protein [Thermicanus aegyptius]
MEQKMPYILLDDNNQEELVDEKYFLHLLNDLSLPESVLMLRHQGVIGKEVRRFNPGWWYSYQKTPGSEKLLSGKGSKKHVPGVETLRIFSFGSCQLACPYCKRDMQEFAEASVAPMRIRDLFRLAERTVREGERIRLSGGDPSAFPRISLAIARYSTEVLGHKASIAHHSLAPNWLKSISPYLLSAALDLKGTPDTILAVAGIVNRHADGNQIFNTALKGIRLAAESGILLDVRTPVFASTTLNDMRLLANHLCEIAVAEKPIFWTWRPYKPVKHEIPAEYRTPLVSWEAPEKEKVMEMAIKVSRLFPKLPIGIKLAWNNAGMIYIHGARIINEDMRMGWVLD